MRFYQFLAHPFFLHFFVPLVTVGFGVFLQIISRNDRFATFKKEDLAFGLRISVTALILFITDSARVAGQIVASGSTPTPATMDRFTAIPWILLALFFGIMGVSTLVRKLGWKNESELTWICGILIPNLFGIICLLVVVNWIGS